MSHLSEIVGVYGAYEFLQELEASSKTAYPVDELVEIMTRYSASDPQATIEDFVAASILHRDGEQFGLTVLGIKTYYLLDAINGGDIRDVYRRLSRLDSTLRTYELIREGMTKAFLQNINERPGFSRLYFCSPWISLDRKQQEMLTHAVIRVEKARGVQPEILVITRPEEGTIETIPKTLKPFQDLGASIFLNRRLHTKLYIREPDRSGGYIMAIVGSQNLTKSNYLELGIRINSDNQVIDHLIAYFWEITNYSHEV
ncbi:MAG: hypothetical protein A2W35_04835 [Chloroflexi bacterium RBG_16_57_11]|nr:MAG: hypothetical protein A2W35_04835 [Chloroflexi bacterium RBG_16_57_11]